MVTHMLDDPIGKLFALFARVDLRVDRNRAEIEKLRNEVTDLRLRLHDATKAGKRQRVREV